MRRFSRTSTERWCLHFLALLAASCGLSGCDQKQSSQEAFIQILVQQSVLDSIADEHGMTADFASFARSEIVFEKLASTYKLAFDEQQRSNLTALLEENLHVESDSDSAIYKLRVELDSPLLSLSIAQAWSDEIQNQANALKRSNLFQEQLRKMSKTRQRANQEFQEALQAAAEQGFSFSEQELTGGSKASQPGPQNSSAPTDPKSLTVDRLKLAARQQTLDNIRRLKSEVQRSEEIFQAIANKIVENATGNVLVEGRPLIKVLRQATVKVNADEEVEFLRRRQRCPALPEIQFSNR